MTRFIAVMAFVVSAFVAQGAFAKEHDDNGRGHHSVPELSGAGAAAGLILVGGATAIVLGRRRARKSKS
ncbi:MAG TPA: hypothetical protein VN914_13075 [Polyangia bacterium]|nr:hypothetical protein [Polyangia bacterium]